MVKRLKTLKSITLYFSATSCPWSNLLSVSATSLHTTLSKTEEKKKIITLLKTRPGKSVLHYLRQIFPIINLPIILKITCVKFSARVIFAKGTERILSFSSGRKGQKVR